MIILLRLLVNAGGLLAISYFVDGIVVDTLYIAVISALILGILNVFIKPIVQILALPLTILTLGLFALVINGLFFWFVASFVEGFSVDSFLSALIGALLMSLISWLTNKFLESE